MLASRRGVTDKEKVSRYHSIATNELRVAAGGGASVALFVFVLALMPFVNKFRLIVDPDLCLSPVGEGASVDIEQYSDVCECVAIEMQSASVAYFLCR